LIGEDGEGYELKTGLQEKGVEIDFLIETKGCFTPTYIKPMLLEKGTERELNRIDIKNRRPCPPEVELQVIEDLRQMASQVDAVVVVDQVQEKNCGVITAAVRTELAALSQKHSNTIFIADSRTRIGHFRSLWTKPNRSEAYRAIHKENASSVTFDEAVPLGRELEKHTGRPVFLTISEEGILLFNPDSVYHIPTLQQTGPIDICGAGDSTMAGIALALCSNASPEEAAVIGNLVASITVQQIGVTGTASRQQVLDCFSEHSDSFQPRRIM
jgi:bifunctional ADP-heptose synthase (sugar kinase/adenylyltransferase)